MGDSLQVSGKRKGTASAPPQTLLRLRRTLLLPQLLQLLEDLLRRSHSIRTLWLRSIRGCRSRRRRRIIRIHRIPPTHRTLLLCWRRRLWRRRHILSARSPVEPVLRRNRPTTIVAAKAGRIRIRRRSTTMPRGQNQLCRPIRRVLHNHHIRSRPIQQRRNHLARRRRPIRAEHLVLGHAAGNLHPGQAPDLPQNLVQTRVVRRHPQQAALIAHIRPLRRHRPCRNRPRRTHSQRRRSRSRQSTLAHRRTSKPQPKPSQTNWRKTHHRYP